MHIAILGHGIEGKAAAEYFLAKGEEVTVCDSNQGLSLPKTLGAQLGPDYLKNLERFDLVVRSPGISPNIKELQPIRSKLTSATKIFFDACPCPVIGVTGTKGKGTTASLLHAILSQGEKRVFLGGNIGVPMLSFLNQVTKSDLVILELSSFQLMDLQKSPHVAVVLGITPDHLDYHKDFEEYVAAKQNIVRHQTKNDVAIIDVDSAESAACAKLTSARVREVSTTKSVRDGAFVKVDSFTLLDGNEGSIFGTRGNTRLLGEHNVKNILAAAAAAQTLGAPLQHIQSAVQNFKGLPHRLEHVARKEGVDFYNDSASTNPETTIAAIRSFKRPEIIILGGSGKGVSFASLAAEVVERENVKSVIVFGEMRQEISAAIEKAAIEERMQAIKAAAKKKEEPIPPHKLEIIQAESVAEAFMVAKMLAQEGDVVLLSPACASFDMFSNYIERGEMFRNFVLDT
ncbi:UDP-N-acetylmuramoyl-L-alanine--D-glutamate ligase [Candidatus Peregrinibacteria bacterium CG11_big_fil_rev_8_21_14_0_20_46_8]|nr:MAG: UDP-N-acetylmuramoyl-L-alanine--D-glutamate ligase [Candidatus Peregrinibacteria bacterium CG11_big_fil_rev_8_21_14_0_20_46_8]